MDNIESQIHEKMQKKWSLSNRPDADLKEIAKDIYNNLIFTDRHCRGSELTQRFMCLMFMGPGMSSDDSVEGKRDNKIYDILEKEIEEKYYNEYINKIGMIFEYYSKAGPMALNGGPMFMSHSTLNKEDAEKVWEYYDKYKTIRETADNF